ncbi:MAG: hypothetical protein OHK0050_12090 [Roseiflexaceae bacterium]
MQYVSLGLILVAMVGMVGCAAPTPAEPTSTPVAATSVPTATPVPPTATTAPTATPVPPTATTAPTATPVPPTVTPLPERPEVVGKWVYMQDEGCDGSYEAAQDVVFTADGQATSRNRFGGVVDAWQEDGDSLTVRVFANADLDAFRFNRDGRIFTSKVGDFCLELRPAFPNQALPSGLLFHTLVPLADGSLIAIGGSVATTIANETVSNPDVFRYDPQTGDWSTIGSIGAGYAGGIIAHLDDDRILITGGTPLYQEQAATQRTIIFDPASGETTTAADIGYSFTSAASVVLADGRVLVSGGYITSDDQTIPYTTTMIYDPAADSWQEAAPMAINRVNHRLTLLEDGRVLATGGLTWNATANQFNDTGVVTIYDPNTDTWQDAPEMQSVRQYHSAVRLNNGQVLVVGGFTREKVGTNVVAEIYDPAANTWRDIGLPPGDHSGITNALLLPDGTVFVVGGGYYFQGNSRAVSIYDPASNTWSERAPLVILRSLHQMALLPDGHVLVVGGASGNGGSPSSYEIYDPSGEGSTTITP